MTIMYMFIYITFALIFVPCTCTRQGTYFVKENTFYASYSSWIVTFTYDLESYKDHLNDLREQIYGFRTMFHDLAALETKDVFPTPISQHHQDIKKLRVQTLQLINEETQSFQDQYNELESLFREAENLASRTSHLSRPKRSFIPIAVSFFNLLFGLSTRSDLKHLRRAITQLASTQEKLIHVVDDSLTLLNKTHHYVTENRNAINDLVNVTNALQHKLGLLYTEVKDVVEPEITFLQLTDRINNVFQLVSTALQSTKFSLLELLDQIQSSAQGTLSLSLIKPVQLESILRTIRKQLPDDVLLPFELLPPHLGQYYKYLSTLLIPDRGIFHVLTAIPLMHANSCYDKYVAHTIPFPNGLFSAEYDIDNPHFGISPDRRSYVILTEIEAFSCKAPFCTITSPSFPVKSMPLCVIALFLNKGRDIEKFCKKSITKTPPTPIVKYLFNGNWLISFKNKLKVTISCSGSNAKVPNVLKKYLEPGINLLKMENDCAAFTEYFNIPHYTNKNTQTSTIYQYKNEIGLKEKLPDIWNDTSDYMHKLSKTSKKNGNLTFLSKIEDLPLDTMKNILHDAMQENKGVRMQLANHKSIKFLKIIGIVSIIVVVIALIVIIIWVYFYKRNLVQQWWPTLHKLRAHVKGIEIVPKDPEQLNQNIEMKEITQDTVPNDEEQSNENIELKETINITESSKKEIQETEPMLIPAEPDKKWFLKQ